MHLIYWKYNLFSSFVSKSLSLTATKIRLKFYQKFLILGSYIQRKKCYISRREVRLGRGILNFLVIVRNGILLMTPIRRFVFVVTKAFYDVSWVHKYRLTFVSWCHSYYVTHFQTCLTYIELISTETSPQSWLRTSYQTASDQTNSEVV